MKLMTYNIRLGIQQGVAACADVVRAADPDIVALQEVGRQWRMGPGGDTAAEIADAIGRDHLHFVTTICDDQHRYGHALVSRWPICSPRRVGFSQTIDEPRAALCATVDAPWGPLAVVATHLSHLDDERAIQGPELVELVGEVGARADRVCVLGDLNESDDVPWLAELQTSMDDAGALANPGATFPNPDPTKRIDYALVRGARWQAAQVVDNARASDHRPVVATLTAQR